MFPRLVLNLSVLSTTDVCLVKKSCWHFVFQTAFSEIELTTKERKQKMRSFEYYICDNTYHDVDMCHRHDGNGVGNFPFVTTQSSGALPPTMRLESN